MTLQQPLEDFSENLRQDVIALAETEEHGMMLADSFTQTAFDMLSEAGECDDPLVCYHKARGVEVSGYGIDEEEGRLDLFLSIHTNQTPPVTVPQRDVNVAFRRLRSFVEWCLRGRYVELEESSPVFDMAAYIHSFKGNLAKVRLCVLTDGRSTFQNVPQDPPLGGVEVVNSLWDIVRFHRMGTSGHQRETISIDLMERFGKPIPCIQAENNQEGYRAFMMLVPGEILRGIYDDFGSRLLESNVRSFLQARGKVNRGIRDTILREPERFLAYNNGITVTAERVEVCDSQEGAAIARMNGLQIVNGGQTTASLLATDRGRADLSQVYVAAKLIEIDTGDTHDELVRNVSRYSNSQNRISEADFSSNDPFHVRIEELSRTIWAPAVGGSQRQTKWFYERARGQYQVAKSSEPTPARRRAFSDEHPTKQRFSKTDLAKYENTWDQLPHIVSKGAQANFSDYMIRHGERQSYVPDRLHFERLIAKAILFKSSERIVQRQNFGGYRANIVTYTLALLSNATTQRIDLGRIWQEQALSANLEEAIVELSHGVHRSITNPPSARNITQWCKQEECWEIVKRDVSTRGAVNRLESELLDISGTRNEQRRSISELSRDHVENLTRLVKVDSAGWRILAEWGAGTDSLDPSQRHLAQRIGRAIQRGQQIKVADAARAVAILDSAKALGFSVEAD